MSATAEKIHTEERPHHPYSPSKLQYLEVCPHYESRQGDHKASKDGTRQHAVAETGEDDHRLDDEQALSVAKCLDYVERRLLLLNEARTRELVSLSERSGGRLTIEQADLEVPKVQSITEPYLPIDDEIVWTYSDGVPVAHKATTAGYADRIFISHDGKFAILIDFKFGKWEVEDAENNLQGMGYVLGLLKQFPALQRVEVVFLQPVLDVVSSHTFSVAERDGLYLRIKVVVSRAQEARKRGDFSMANPTTPACMFCANIGHCPKVTEFACKIGAKFMPLEIPSDLTPTALHDPAMAATGIRLAQTLKVWAEAFRKQKTEQAVRSIGKNVPDGYELASRADRELVDVPKFREITLKYLTEAELAAQAQYSFGSVEDAIKEKAPRGQKGRAVEAYQEELEQAGATKRGTPYAFLKAVSK